MSSSVDWGCSLAKDDVGESAVGNEASPELVKELMQLKPLLPYVCHIKNCGKGHPTPSAYKFHARTYHGRNGRSTFVKICFWVIFLLPVTYFTISSD